MVKKDGVKQEVRACDSCIAKLEARQLAEVASEDSALFKRPAPLRV